MRVNWKVESLAKSDRRSMSDRLQRSGLDGETAHRTSESGFGLLKIDSITAIGSVAATGGSPYQSGVQLGWYDVAPVRNGIEWRYVADLEAKDYPQSGIIVGAANLVDLLGRERIKRKHILHSGDPTTNAFDSA